MRINMFIGDQPYPILLNDSQAAKDFYHLLPLNVTLNEYNGTEKICHLSERLDVHDSLIGMTAESGQLNYYVPMGNLCLFYEDFPYSQGLVNLGSIEEAIPFEKYVENIFVSFRQIHE